VWLLRESILLDGVEDQITAKLFSAKLFHQAAIAGADVSTEYGVKQFNNALREYVRLGRLLLPYLAWPELPDDKISKDEVQNLRSEWEQVFGSTTDPVVQAELEYLRRIAGEYVARPAGQPAGGQWA